MSGSETVAARLREMDQILHEKAKSCLPPNLVSHERGIFAVAVLGPGADVTSCSSDDFVWYKVRGRNHIDKIKKQCNAVFKASVTLEVVSSNPVTLATQIQQLDSYGDHIVAFTAQLDTANETPQSPGNTILPVRSPLAPLPVNESSPQRIGNILPKREDQGAMRGAAVDRLKKGRSPIATKNSAADHTPTFPPSIKGEQDEIKVKYEVSLEDSPMPDAPELEEPETSPPPTKTSQSIALQKLIETASPEELETEVKRSRIFLNVLHTALAAKPQAQQDADHWLRQVEQLEQRKVDTPTVIGVVGNTGAGKSSVINAVLDSERLLVTNCMRACTAVVTEISWNHSNKAWEKYRAEIEFIQAADWEKDLSISLKELLDMSGNVSKESTNPDTEAGVAYAKIKAVYPSKTREMLAKSTVQELMNDANVKNILGKTRKINDARPDIFYKELQKFVDSKEKSTGVKGKDKSKKEKRQMEFWPLIKVVRIYTKSEALSTGAVIVDLPGVHDSNAARAAVANGYMKSCTGLWIVAPINRAVDDKTAKNLLGESFKRQLKYDGTYSRVTFICSKTDDISVTEASDSLDLTEQMEEDWDRLDQIDDQIKEFKKMGVDIRESRDTYSEIVNHADDEIDVWENLRDELDSGSKVFAPTSGANSQKRKRAAEVKKSNKKTKIFNADDDMDRFIVDDEDDPSEGSDEDSSCSDSDADRQLEQDRGEPLTEETIDAKISEFKSNRKEARRRRMDTDAQARQNADEIEKLEVERAKIDGAMSAICIAGRNQYSKGAIQQDFAAGIKDLDQETAQEIDEENFNPDEEMRDYEEVANSLPVFCVSSRAYQKLCGRMQRDADQPAFKSVEETEIPQLQAHCKKLTEAGRTSNCRQFLVALSQMLNSLNIWASDGTGSILSGVQVKAEARYLKSLLSGLEERLDKAVSSCVGEMKHTLAEHIFDNYDNLVQTAVNEANDVVAKWGMPVNRDQRDLGGFYWATYKAICRREGLFSNAQGTHDFNSQLCEPIIKHLAGHWERVFAQRMPRVLKSFAKNGRHQLNSFHQQVKSRGLKHGISLARLSMLNDQIKNYEAAFDTMTQQLEETIKNQQRDANREFVPVIANNLAGSYEWCAAETGPGQFKRMKDHMFQHVDSRRMIMFREAVVEVRKRLDTMCRTVEDQMCETTDRVFIQMSRDYNLVVSGTQLPEGEVTPKWERQLKAQLAKLIETREVGSENIDEEEPVFQRELEASAEKMSEQDGPTAEDEDQDEDTLAGSQDE